MVAPKCSGSISGMIMSAPLIRIDLPQLLRFNGDLLDLIHLFLKLEIAFSLVLHNLPCIGRWCGFAYRVIVVKTTLTFDLRTYFTFIDSST